MTFLPTLLATFAKNGMVKRVVRWQFEGRCASAPGLGSTRPRHQKASAGGCRRSKAPQI